MHENYVKVIFGDSLLNARATRELSSIIEDLRKMNERLAISNDKTSRAMFVLTIFLVIVGLLQVFASFLSILLS